MAIRDVIPSGIPRGVWVLAATSALTSTGFGMAVPLIPVYGSRLGASAFEIGLLMAGFFAGRLVAEIPAGLAADRVGRRPVALLALAGYAATCFGYALSGTVWLLIAFRVLQGLSSGFFGVAARSLVSDLCDARVRGSGQGVFSASYNLGFVAGPVLGAFWAQRFDITTPFLAAGVMCLVALVGLSWVVVRKDSRPRNVASASEPRPGLTLDTRVFLLAGSNLMFWAGMSVVMTLFPIAGEADIEGGLGFVGIALTAAGLCGLLFGPAAGRLSDRLGRAPLITLGALLAAAEGTALLTTTDPVVITICFGIGGIGAATYTSVLFAALGDMTSWQGRGTVTGIVGAAGVLGGIIGALVAPMVWERTDLTTPFGLQTVFAVAAAVLAIFLWRSGPPPTPSHPVISEPIIQG